MKHALVVGGTGMLADVSIWLLDQGYHVSIIARNSVRLHQLMERTSFKNKLTPLLVDYRNSDELQQQVHTTIEQNGEINLIVAWIHAKAPDALEVIAKEVSAHTADLELFHVLGSSKDLSKTKQEATFTKDSTYYQVRLGFVIKNNYSRWLTNKEISSGVIEALKQKDTIRTIGQIEPWERRP
ncbi:short-chain dehydrogenase [Oceanobacillus sp. FSL K6-2867]|uniref:short-chain dehydrogenase n=1 Tax=Oceanobacillus sp. FSL K6-2867 TaxID=2954748 RepID=UPI0030DD2860